MFKKKSGKKYFGVELDQNSGEVPELVVEAIKYLEGHLNESGLFRISGQMNIITDIKNKWDKGVHEDFSKQPIPHNVTGVLKLYLKEMPEPLMTFSRYEAFLHLGGEKDLNVRLQETKKLLQSLPKTNYATMKALLNLLNKIAACSATNNMRAANLSMVFAPNVFRPEVETIEYIVSDTPLTNSEFEFMIENYPSLFDDPTGKTLTSAGSAPAQAAGQPQEAHNANDGGDLLGQLNGGAAGGNDPLKMMSDDFNMEEWANLGGEMLEPNLGGMNLGMGGADDNSLMVPQMNMDGGGGNEGVPQDAPNGDEAQHNDPVWNFRAQSYVVIENIYEITDVISENIPSTRCISEFVYIATLLLETFEGIQSPVEESLPPSSTAPLQHVKDADETRLMPLLDLCTDLLTQVADEIGAYVESLAEKMSLIEDLEPLRPLDERFRWIENTLVRANDAFEEPGAYVPDDPNAVSDVVVDASVVREIPGVPEDIDTMINLEGYVEESGDPNANANVGMIPPPQPMAPAPALPSMPAPAPPVEATATATVQAANVPVAATIPAPVPAPAPAVSAAVVIPPMPQSQFGSLPQKQPQQQAPQVNKAVQTQIKIQSNVVNVGGMNPPSIPAPVAPGVAAAPAPAPSVANIPNVAPAAAVIAKTMQAAQVQQKTAPAGATPAPAAAAPAATGAAAPAAAAAKTAQTPVKKAEKPKTEGQRLDGSMLAEPTGKIIEVIQLIKNDLRTIEPNEARSLCTLFSNIKIMIEHPNDDPGKLALITASMNIPSGVGIIGYTDTILIETIHLLQELKGRCVAKMHSADAITTANLLKAITKAIIERDKAELESLEG